MEWIARIRLLIAALAWFLAVGMHTAQAADAKAKAVYLPHNVKVVDDKSSTGGERDYLLTKGADVDHSGWDGTFFIEEGAKLSITYARGGRYAVFLKKGGELAGEANDHTLIIYYEKGAKIDKRIGDQHVRIECDSLLFKPFQPFLLQGTVRDAGGKAVTGIRVHSYGFAEEHLDTAITNRDGEFTFRPAKTVAYVAADLARIWRTDLALRNNTLLDLRQHTQPLRGWEAEVREGCWGQDTTLAIAPSGERRLLLRQLHKLTGHERPIKSMAFSRDGGALATANESTLIRVWDVANGRVRHVFDAGCSTSRAVIAPNGKILAYGSGDGFLRLGDVAKDRCLHERRITPEYPLHDLAFAPDSKLLAATMGQTILLWDVASGKPRGALAAPPRGVSSLVFNPNGRILFSAGHARHRGEPLIEGGDDPIRAWDVTTGHELRRYAGEANRVALSADGEWLIASGQQARVFVWHVDSGRQALQIESEADAIALTPDDKLLIVLAGDVLHFWELASRQEVFAVPVPDPRNDVAALSPDGRILASSQYGGSVILWDVRPHHLYVPEAKSRSDAEWEKLWVDLASDKAATAYRALWTLLREPPRAVTLLLTHLQPTPPRELPLDKWIADLDNDDFAKRQAAAKSLHEAGAPAERALRKARGGKLSLEARKRIDQLLEEIGQRRPSAEELRSLRAIQLLEEIGSPEACRLLESLAKGWDEARQTHEAKAALKRLHTESRAAKDTD